VLNPQLRVVLFHEFFDHLAAEDIVSELLERAIDGLRR
jgi:hypothetical protein